MSRSTLFLFGVAGVIAAIGACSANNTTGTTGSGGDTASCGTNNGSTGKGVSSTHSSGAGGTPDISVTVGSGGGTENGCSSKPDEDFDMDGWSTNDGDCNDCDANVNPGA